MAPEIANRDFPFEIFEDKLRWGATDGSRLADDIEGRQARELGSSIGHFGQIDLRGSRVVLQAGATTTRKGRTIEPAIPGTSSRAD